MITVLRLCISMIALMLFASSSAKAQNWFYTWTPAAIPCSNSTTVNPGFFNFVQCTAAGSCFYDAEGNWGAGPTYTVSASAFAGPNCRGSAYINAQSSASSSFIDANSYVLTLYGQAESDSFCSCDGCVTLGPALAPC